MKRGAPVTDLELYDAVRWHSTNFEFLDLFLRVLAGKHCAAPSTYAKAIEGRNASSIVQRLLNAGVDPRGKIVPDDLQSPTITHNLHFDIDEKLLESVLERAVVLQGGKFLHILLHIASWTRQDKGRALTLCLAHNKHHLIQVLLDAEADVNQELMIASDYITPLVIAIKMQNYPLTKKLLSAGADIKWTPPACMHGPTMLQRAVDAGDKEIVKLLLLSGADVNESASSRGGKTALQQATHNGNIELVDTLLTAGADVNQGPALEGGATALQFASIRGYIGIARRLLDEGADIDAPRSLYFGRTALEGAAGSGRIDTLHLLLVEGASVHGTGRKQYVRAIKLAESRTHYAAAELLRDFGGWDEEDARQQESELFDFEEWCTTHE